MPNAVVFPGGATEVEDFDAAVALGLTRDESTAAAVGAIREVLEEAGIGLTRPHHIFASMEERNAIRANPTRFVDVCEREGVSPDIGRVFPLCRFITPTAEAERFGKGFDTRFFLAPVPSDTHAPTAASVKHRASADEAETHSLVWLTPERALEQFESGQIFLPPPQWYILRELAKHCSSFSDLITFTRAPPATSGLQPGMPIQPRVLQGEWSARNAAAVDAATTIAAPGSSATRNHASSGSAKNERFVELLLPGDEEHHEIPGQPGARHRVLWDRHRNSYELLREGVSFPELLMKCAKEKLS